MLYITADAADAPTPRVGIQQYLIAIVLPDLGAGGAELVMVRLAREFRARGYPVDVVLLRATGELMISGSEAGWRVIDLGASSLAAAPRALRKYLVRERPRVVLTALWPLTTLVVAATRSVYPRPRVVVSEHNTLSLSTRPARRHIRALLRPSLAITHVLADAVAAVSYGVRTDLRCLTWGRLANAHVIYNPAAVAPKTSFEPFDVRPPVTWCGAKHRLVAVGSLKAQKGFDVLIDAFAQVRDELSAQLLILGEGSLRGSLTTQIRSRGLENDVVLMGHVPNPRPYLEMASLFVLSSRYEGFGNVIVEALEAGLPIVATDCKSGPAEILDRGKYGRLVPVGDSDALAMGLRLEATLPRSADEQRLRADHFTIDRAADAYLRLLDPATSRPRPPRGG